jgi:hypothetical protein
VDPLRRRRRQGSRCAGFTCNVGEADLLILRREDDGRARLKLMAVSRAERRASRRERVVRALGETMADPALDLLELVELAWHDCHGEITPPDDVIDDILVLSHGELSRLVSAAHLAVTDWRDARVAADAVRD